MFFSLPTYQVIWWCAIIAILTLFALTAGFDLGIGSLLPFVGRSNIERRVMLNVIGPTWDGNQVWLIIGGAGLFAIWPRAYALAFSGFYGALMLALWTLFLRPTGFEWRAKIEHSAWQKTWDWAIFVGSAFPAIAFGLLIGNLLQGVPFYYIQDMRVVYTGHLLELFNPFAILCGLVSLFMLVSHGAMFLIKHTEDTIQQRAKRFAHWSLKLFLMTFIIAGVWIKLGLPGLRIIKPASIYNPLANVVKFMPSALLENYVLYPWMMIAPIAAIFGAITSLIALRFNKATLGFLLSGVMIIGTLLTAAFSSFPLLIPSITHPAQSLTIWNASASPYTLQALFIVAVIMLPTIGLYSTWVFNKMWGTVTVRTIEKDGKQLY